MWRMALPRLRDVALEVQKAPADRDPEPRRRRLVATLELEQRVLELAARASGIGGANVRGDELMMKRRNDDLDAVVLDHGEPFEQMLLGRQVRRGSPAR